MDNETRQRIIETWLPASFPRVRAILINKLAGHSEHVEETFQTMMVSVMEQLRKSEKLHFETYNKFKDWICLIAARQGEKRRGLLWHGDIASDSFGRNYEVLSYQEDGVVVRGEDFIHSNSKYPSER